MTYQPLPLDVPRCNGFTCPLGPGLEDCQRFSERGLAVVNTPWTKGTPDDLGGCGEFAAIRSSGIAPVLGSGEA